MLKINEDQMTAMERVVEQAFEERLFRMARRNEYDVHDPARPSIKLPAKPWIALRIVKA